jgi:hypothetical protein
VKIRIVVATFVLAATACFGEAAIAAGAPAAVPKKEALSPEAEALFVEGRKLFDARKFAEACDKLAESHKLSPSVKALGLLGACHEEQGRIATAYGEYLDTAERARKLGDSREAFARKRAAALKATLPVVHIEVTSPAPGLAITQNGKVVSEGALEESYVDPGPVEIVAKAPGKKEWRTEVTAAPKARISVMIPELAPEVSEPDPATLTAPTSASVSARMPGMRLAGFITGGAGLALVALGSGIGLAAIGQTKASKADGHCDKDNYCDLKGTELRNDARSKANAATAFFVVGSAAVVTGAVLLLLPSRESKSRAPAARSLRVTVSGDKGGGGVTVLGSF